MLPVAEPDANVEVVTAAVVTFTSCNLKLLLLLPSIATIRGAVAEPSTLLAVLFIIVSAVPFFHTPLVVFAVHCPSMITLLMRFSGALISYVPLATRMIAWLVEVPPVARVRALETVFTGAVEEPLLLSLPLVDTYINFGPQSAAEPPEVSGTRKLAVTVALAVPMVNVVVVAVVLERLEPVPDTVQLSRA